MDAEGWGASVFGRVFAAVYSKNLDQAIPALVAAIGRRDGAGAETADIHRDTGGDLAMMARPKSIDGYLATLGAAQRAALARLRRAIRSAAPEAVECISYQLPAFRLGGRFLVAFGAASKHCAFYSGS